MLVHSNQNVVWENLKCLCIFANRKRAAPILDRLFYCSLSKLLKQYKEKVDFKDINCQVDKSGDVQTDLTLALLIFNWCSIQLPWIKKELLYVF